MPSVQLTRGKQAWFDQEDLHTVLSFLPWQATPGKNGVFYATAAIGGVTILMHRLIARAALHDLVDHKNGDGLDNRRENLRVVTHTENAWNMDRRSDNKSGFKGVYLDPRRGTWNFSVSAHGRRHYGSGYATVELANQAAQQLREKLHGEFACHGRKA